MTRKRRDIINALLRKGFIEKKGDHRYFHLNTPQLTAAIFTKLSHGTKYDTYDDFLLGRMAKQLHLTKHQLLDLIDCPLSGEEYLLLLQQQGFARMV
jgi:hypothetical protein